MKFNKSHLNIRQKLFLIIGISQLMLLTALTISFIFLIDKIKKEQQNQNAFEKSILFQQQLTNKERILKLVAQKILADPNTSNILKLGVYNRNLLNANLPHFQAIMAEHNLNVFEVGDKQGKVHFRFHRPKDFGDDKSGQIIVSAYLTPPHRIKKELFTIL